MLILDQILKSYCKSVRASVQAYGGTCSWPFTQMYGEVAGIIGGHKATKEGICEMLSAFWIERRASGSSLSAYLGRPGNSASEGIDASKIRQMMQLFIIGSEMNPSAMIEQSYWMNTPADRDQTRATKIWLETKGVRYRSRTTSQRGQGGHSDFGTALGRALVNMGFGGPPSGTYATIGIWGGGGGHAMAAYLNGNTVIFFDPNYGEFTFNDSNQFKNWFTVFWYKGTYGRKHLGANLSDKYEIMTYAR